MKIPFVKLHGAKNDFLLTNTEDAPEARSPAGSRSPSATAIPAWAPTAGCWSTRVAGSGLRRLHPAVQLRRQRAGTLRQRHALRRGAARTSAAGCGSDSASAPAPASSTCGCFRRQAAASIQFEMNMGDIRVVELQRQGAGPRCRDRRRGQSAVRACRSTISISTGAALGAAIERDPRFPNRTNVSFVRSGGRAHDRRAFLGTRRGRNQQFRHRLHRARPRRPWRAAGAKAR